MVVRTSLYPLSIPFLQEGPLSDGIGFKSHNHEKITDFKGMQVNKTEQWKIGIEILSGLN